MSKPTLEQLERELAAGRAVEVMVEVRGIRLNGNVWWPSDKGVVYDDHSRVRDVNGVVVIGPGEPKGLKGIVAKARKGATSILKLIDNPIIHLLVPASRLSRIRRLISLPTLSRTDLIGAILDDVGSERAREIWDAIEAARADGKVTQEEIDEILRVATGK